MKLLKNMIKLNQRKIMLKNRKKKKIFLIEYLIFKLLLKVKKLIIF